MRNIRSTPTAHHNKKRTFTHGTLYTCTHVFVRVESEKLFGITIRRTIPEPTLSERITDRIFKIILNGEATSILVDRLKSTFIEAIPDEQKGPSYM